LPFSTAADFPAVHPEQVRTLALAATFLNLYVMLLDPVIDEPLAAPAAAKLAIQPVLLRFYRSLNHLFPADPPFWSEIERLMDLMSQTMLEEHQRLSGPVSPFSEDEFRRIAQGKMAFALINGVALATLNGTPELIPALAQCWDAIGLASIVQDDALDWREDYRNANCTYLLSQVLFSPDFRGQVEAGHLPKLGQVGGALFCTDVMESFHELAYKELGTAARRAAGIDCPALAGLLCQLQAWIGSRLAEPFDRKIAALTAVVAATTRSARRNEVSSKE
jgi:hypothetical protein